MSNPNTPDGASKNLVVSLRGKTEVSSGQINDLIEETSQLRQRLMEWLGSHNCDCIVMPSENERTITPLFMISELRPDVAEILLDQTHRPDFIDAVERESDIQIELS